MKTIAIILNGLLISVVSMMIASRGMPLGGWPLLLLFLATPTISILALHDRSADPDGQEQKQQLFSSASPALEEEREPLYEWIETVERRLSSIEAGEAKDAQNTGT